MSTKRLMRPTDDRMLAGVASGVARYFGIDPTIVRVAFVVLTLIGVGAMILVYIALWIVMPDEARLHDAGADFEIEGEASARALGDDVHDAVEGAVDFATSDQDAASSGKSTIDPESRAQVERAIDRATKDDPTRQG